MKSKADIIEGVRTNLLILVSKELSNNKKYIKTMINSRTLCNAEKEMTEQNSHIVVLKSENFFSNHDTNFGENKINVNFKSPNSNFLLKLPSKPSSASINSYDLDSVSSSLDSTILGFTDTIKMNITNKTSISTKKNEYFFKNTLNSLRKIDEKNEQEVDYKTIFEHNLKDNKRQNIKKTVEDIFMNKLHQNELDKNLELINIDMGFAMNKMTRKRAKRGFQYLHRLKKKFKITLKTKKSRSSFFEGFKDILSEKDRVENNENELDINEGNSNQSISNQPKSNFIVFVNGKEENFDRKSKTKNGTVSFKNTNDQINDITYKRSQRVTESHKNCLFNSKRISLDINYVKESNLYSSIDNNSKI